MLLALQQLLLQSTCQMHSVIDTRLVNRKAVTTRGLRQRICILPQIPCSSCRTETMSMPYPVCSQALTRNGEIPPKNGPACLTLTKPNYLPSQNPSHTLNQHGFI
jgi:hypothetical protein